MYRGFPVGYLLFWANLGANTGRQIGADGKQQEVARLLIVDAKRYKGRLTVQRGVVRVAGRDITKLLDQARSHAAVAAAALEAHPAAMAVPPVLCFVGTELPRRHTVVGGVHLVTRKGLTRLLSRSPAVLTEAEVAQAADLLDKRLVPA